MATALAKYERYVRRRKRRAARDHQRLDIQGLRMVAVLTVFANHLWDWPSGGFIGVDVFFVISGFLITSNLLRSAERPESASAKTFFWKFYWGRVRRIVPAATVVLILTCVAAALMFLPLRAGEVFYDAVWAFFFGSNWWFAWKDTDYFTADDSVSPLQHYWSLSIEEQFYFVWPAVIFLIGLYVVRKARSHDQRMRAAGMVMVVIVGLSLAWALYETMTSPTWAYFNTFSRVWELGAGALVACFADKFTNMPQHMRPIVSWAGLGLIAASIFIISDDSGGFPVPWAILPVVGSALVIIAGIGAEPHYQAFLRNPASGYIGNISYSLYLVHWPVIIFAGYLIGGHGALYSIVVIGVAFGLAIASYQFVEQPLRHFEVRKVKAGLRDIRKHRFHPKQENGYAAAGALACIAIALVAFVARPIEAPTAPPSLAVAAPDDVDPSGPEIELGPEGAMLQEQIAAALQATEWPAFDPPLEDVLRDGAIDADILPCTNDNPTVNIERCTFGSPNAPIRIILAGDSEGNSYAGAMREIALSSGGQVQVLNMSMASCAFTAELVNRLSLTPNCAARKQHVVDTVNALKPNLVVISNLYRLNKAVGSDRLMSDVDWGKSMRKIIDQFAASTGKVVLLSGPPGQVDIKDCTQKRSNVPADCIGRVAPQWNDIARSEQKVAAEVGGAWIDSRPWFCGAGQFCPSFVGNTLTKSDEFHLAAPYGRRIAPVIKESFAAAGVPLS